MSKAIHTAYDYKNKRRNIRDLNNYMFAKTLRMFEWQGLPETIPHREIEKLLQQRGYCFVTEVDGQLYALWGGLGGVEDVYGNPTQIVISNPALNFNKTLDLKTDGVLICNDDMKMGLYPIFEKGNSLLVENDINLVMWGFNSRTQKLISAPDDKTKDSANQYLKKIVDGELAVIGENPFFDGVKVQASGTAAGADSTPFIAYHQYLKSNLYNEVGISSNFNMKAERLISSELDAAEDSLFPLVYSMMANRIAGVEAINAMYGQSISVDFGSIWALKNKELVDDVTDNNEDITDVQNPAAVNEENPDEPQPVDESDNPDSEPSETETEVNEEDNQPSENAADDEQPNESDSVEEDNQDTESEDGANPEDGEPVEDAPPVNEEDEEDKK